jgi:uncharacterized protein (DUF302 family)
MSDPVQIASTFTFEETVSRLVRAIETAGMTTFAQIDHAAGARAAGLEMPSAMVLIYGHARGGTPIMVSTPVAALDLPLRVLIFDDGTGQTMVAFHPVSAMLQSLGVPEELAKRLEPAQHLLQQAVGAMEGSRSAT